MTMVVDVIDAQLIYVGRHAFLSVWRSSAISDSLSSVTQDVCVRMNPIALVCP